MSEAKIAFTFGELEHGWVDIEIMVNGECLFCDSVSYTPNDGIRDFLGAMKAALASQGAVGRCDWSNEPGFFALFLENHAPELHFLMRFIPDYFRDPTDTDEIWCECTCDLADFTRSFHGAFQELMTQYDAQEYERRWGHSFPLREWQQLLPLLMISPSDC